MRAIVIEKPGLVVVKELPDPMPDRGQVLVRIRAVGLCGTDLHLYQGVFGQFPLIAGHDVAGVIEGVGSGVEPGRVGQRVTIDPAGCCLRAAVPVELCPACRRGDTHLCREATYLGMSVPGAMVELIAVPAVRAVPLEKNVSDEMATVLEPVVVALHLKEKIADRPGDALIIGGGPIGIAAGLVLQQDGRRVTLSEPLAIRRALAQRMGIATVITPEEIRSELPVSLIVETSGHPSATATMVQAAQKGATIVLAGGATDIPGIVILTRELEVRAAKGGRGLYPEAIALVAAGRLPVDRFLSHRFPAAKAAEAFALASQRRDEVTRAVIDLTAW